MEQGKRNPDHDSPFREGRDELNLAEFPIAVLSSRPNKTLKTIHFEDRIWDKGRACWIPRRLTISASDQYGLPTALDDEVILGLIQLTRQAGFDSRQVFFRRYRLLRTLGWRNEGKSYTRLDTSLKRWLGVTFYYENAWWDKASQCWVDENFHLLEQVSLFDRDQRVGRSGVGDLPLSMFTWNEVVFRSFQAGYLKRIDLELYRRLSSPIAKRLYRLLDKRFYHKGRWTFDLRELACEHVGLSRNYDTGQLKRKLRPAIEELESVGYLQPVDAENRFVRVGEGRWQVPFTRGKARRPDEDRQKTGNELKKELLKRGVHPGTADELVASHSAQEMRGRIRVFDWLLQRNDHGLKNAPGYLVQSIRDGYDVPTGFSSANESLLPPPGEWSRRGRRNRRTDPAGREAETVEVRVSRRLRGLAPQKRQRLEEEALAQADPFLGAAYRRAVSERATALADIYRYIILEKHVTSRMNDSQRVPRPGTRQHS